MQANAARLAYRYCRHQLRSPSAREEGDVSLPEPLNGAILAPKLTESGECRLGGIFRYSWSHLYLLSARASFSPAYRSLN